MEVDTMLQGDDQITSDQLPSSQPPKSRHKRQTNFRRLAFTCVAIALVALLGAVALSRWMSNTDKSTSTIEKQRGVEEAGFEATFTTNGIQDEEEEEKVAVPKREKPKTAKAAIPMGPKMARNFPVRNPARSASSRNSRCSLCINKIGLVELRGELGTGIEDDIRTSVISVDEQNRRYLTATVYEDAVYRLQVQLDCGGQLDRDSLGNPCSRSLSVTAWVDFNDNEFDDGESRILRPSWSGSGTPTGAYDGEIRVPTIDGRGIKSGPHRLRLTVAPSDEYQRECGSFRYEELRDYTVNIVRKARPIVITTPRIPDCPLSFAKIKLVLMAGEKGTEIRDDFPKTSVIMSDPKQHHMSVTVFEHTIYLVRIQLHCSTQLKTDLTPLGCNLAQDVILSIDLNGDGRFDDSEIGSPYRWPVTSYMAEGIYDLQVYVPTVTRKYTENEGNLMRILVVPSTYYIASCGFSEYRESRDYSISIIPRVKYSVLANMPAPYIVPRDFQCVSDVGKILLVVMAGEHRSQIRDDASTRAVINSNNPNEQHLTIILYEDTVYLLRVQLECTQLRNRVSYRTNCTLPHDVNAWIDSNDDQTFDDTENATPYRWPLASYIPEGVYDLQLYIPIIDGRKIKSGPHVLRLAVTQDEQYRSKCGNNYYRELREYNVTIIRHNTQPDDTGVPYLPLSDNICSQVNGKIVLVLMTGELGTHIRDDTALNTLVGENQDRHHLAVTLYENTIYRLRIQLDCARPSSKGSYDTNCNLAKDVNVYIDLNNDNTFDETESRVPHRWPLHTSVGLGLYDLEIPIPVIDGYNLKSGAHRVRIVVLPSEEYTGKCGRTDYREVREYTFNIVPRRTYAAVATPTAIPTATAHCSPGELTCSAGHSGIALVTLSGEQNTQITDTTKLCTTTNNYNDRRNLAVTLFDNTAYTLHVELYCANQLGYGNSYEDSYSSDATCSHQNYLDVWVDFNNDGTFDEYNERVSAAGQYNDDTDKTQYDFSINIPKINGRNYVGGQHQMRIILRQDEQNRRPCYNSGYGEARDYTVQILSKPGY